jgi:hypothetical protein
MLVDGRVDLFCLEWFLTCEIGMNALHLPFVMHCFVFGGSHAHKLNQSLPGSVPAVHAARDASRMSDAPTSDI